MKFGKNVYFVSILAKFDNQQTQTTESTLLGEEIPKKIGVSIKETQISTDFYKT